MRGPGGNIQPAKTMSEMAARESDAMGAEILSMAWHLEPTLEVQRGAAMTELTLQGTQELYYL